ncbi:MAG: alpha/beta fold hydrolase [bacterium]
MRRPRLSTMRARIVAGVLALAVVVAVVVIAALATADAPVATRDQFLNATSEPGATSGAAPKSVQLDTRLYLPSHTPAPAVLLAHGFGGDKTDLDAFARRLARQGYVVLAYTARGFGPSGGLIHLDAPDFEVADARRLVDYLAGMREVERDAPGDPRIAVAGSSYGGALALLLGGYDRRIDAVAADITWNSLLHSLLPNSATAPAGSIAGGVFKRLWAGSLFGVGAAGSLDGSGGTGGGSDPATGPAGGTGSGRAGAATDQCGRFAAALCDAYQRLAQGLPPSLATAGLLAQSSPASILDRIKAPTLLSQGEQDSLFPLSEADANARGIAATGTPVAVRWRSGGHDSGGGGDEAYAAAVSWFGSVLRHRAPKADFTMSLSGAGLSAQSGRRVSETLSAHQPYPGTSGVSAPRVSIAVRGSEQTITAPAGGTPAAISSLPGLSDALGVAAGGLGGLTTIPGQVARFDSDPLPRRVLVTGSSTIRVTVTSRPTRDAVLFVSLHDVAPDGGDTLPAQLVAPVALNALTPGQPTTVDVALPGIVTQLEAGHRLRVVVATTDQLYSLPADPRAYSISVASGSATVSVPSVATSTVRNGAPQRWLYAGLAAVVVALAVGAVLVRRAERREPVTDDPDVAPVVVRDLVKEYSDGFRAVDGVSFTVERGQIVGLLGPNGAGKTTTLRVLLGLILPTEGAVEIFGAPAVPGARVLSRVGAFVEGPGLLPHLSGRDNLRLFWAASGRPLPDAQLETALEIAGLGSSIDRRVKTYSQGMRQRLAIAQAMLGLPELLILDEPTNGLDPPQIAEMREVLRSYAATGRTVVVSSHQLAEVQQTCTHVVVMHRGRLVRTGSVEEVAGADGVTLSVADPQRAVALLAAAGMEVETVASRRALEDVFLELVEER